MSAVSNHFRQLLVIALVPLMALSAIPHVACRCSNGEIRYSCPQLEQSRRAPVTRSNRNDVATVSTKKSCCQRSKNATCCAPQGKGKTSPEAACCASGCHCTPVYLAAEIGPTLKKVDAQELVTVDWMAFSEPAVLPVDSPFVDRVQVDISPHVPIDIIVVFGRILV
jgi:hypothetical protein